MPSAPSSHLFPAALKRARVVTIFLFFFNGIALSALTPRLADLQGQLEMSDLALGVVLSAGAAGGLLFGPFAAMGMRKFGSGQFSMIALILMLPLLPLVGLAPSVFILGIVIFGIGAVDSVLDAAQNAHGLAVQRLYKRSIINNMHAFWALGTVAGALIGAVTLALDFSLTWSLFFVSVIGLVGALATFRWLLPKNLNKEVGPAELAHEIHSDHIPFIDPGSIAPVAGLTRFRIGSLLAALGVLTVLAVIVEEVPQRWSSVYLTDLGVDGAQVGFGVVAFTISLTIGRFVGDLYRQPIWVSDWSPKSAWQSPLLPSPQHCSQETSTHTSEPALLWGLELQLVPSSNARRNICERNKPRNGNHGGELDFTRWFRIRPVPCWAHF